MMSCSNTDTTLTVYDVCRMYERLRAEPRTVVQRSPIHNLGLFCTRDINQHDMVIEYVGELVRPLVCFPFILSFVLRTCLLRERAAH